MAREYQRIERTKYILPRSVYHQTIWKVRDYYRLKEEAAEIGHISAIEYTGMPTGSRKHNDHIGEVVAKREKMLEDVNKIDECLSLIPVEYRKGVWDNIQYQSPYPLTADRSTYGRYKSKFIYLLAKKFGLIIGE